MTFFQKLGVYLRAGYLDKKLAFELMGDTVLFWYDNYITKLIDDVDMPGMVNDPFAEICDWLKSHRAQMERAKKQTRLENS